MQVETRARKSREDAEIDADLAERRGRTQSQEHGRRLGVDLSALDFNNFAYRWVNDMSARLFHMTEVDTWSIIKGDGTRIAPKSNDLGDAVSIIVGTKPDGAAMRAYLCRKPRRYHEEDRQKKQTDLDEQLSQLRRGNTASGDEQGDYVPNGGIRIARS